MPALCNAPRPTATEACAVARGNIELVACRRCGHVYNAAFDASRITYAPGYENSLLFSPTLREYAEQQAADLIDRYALHGREAVELGCGDAGFLELLAARGARCTGYDPSAGGDSTTAGGVTIIARDFSAAVGPLAADLVLCRHVLEHVEAPVEFLSTVRASLSRGAQTGIFFEVPNALATLRDLAIWDIVYEHPSYFWRGSLRAAFVAAGFRVEHVEETFGGQFLTAHARTATGPAAEPGVDSAEVRALMPLLDAFAAAYRDKREFWLKELARLASAGRRAVVWGAGTKGVMFLNIFSAADCLDAAVDVNPRKRGLFVAGSGHPIVAPEDLARRRPKAVIVMNPAYAGEIGRRCRELRLDVEILAA